MAPKTIKFACFPDGKTVRATQLAHHRELVLGTMLGALKFSHQGESEVPEIAAQFEQWSVDELMKFGVVSLYHHWERQTKSLLVEQLQVQAPPRREKTVRDDASWFLLLLEKQLCAPTLETAREAIYECRELTNLIKHDTGDKYEETERNFPAHFVAVDGRPAMDRFRVTAQSLDRLFDELIEFWEMLPCEIERGTARRSPVPPQA